jgi:DNA-directed RNA polymerase subunit M/transcription elongation factor TFIIS
MVAGGSGWEDYAYFFCKNCNHLVEVRKPNTKATCENCGNTFEIQWP